MYVGKFILKAYMGVYTRKMIMVVIHFLLLHSSGRTLLQLSKFTHPKKPYGIACHTSWPGGDDGGGQRKRAGSGEKEYSKQSKKEIPKSAGD